MVGFPAKLVAATLSVLLLLGGLPATSPLLSSGDEEGLWWFSGGQGSSRKVAPGNKGSFGCESQVINGEKEVTFQSLRSRRPAPPTPTRNQGKSPRIQIPAPPPPIIY